MPELDLPEKYRLQLISLIRANTPHAEVWAYGSRVTGQSHDTSDLDLVVRNPEDIGKSRLDELFDLKAALQESDLPILVAVLDWAAIPQSFRDEIERAHVVIHTPRQPTAEIAHERTPNLARLGGSEPGLPDIPRRRKAEGTQA